MGAWQYGKLTDFLVSAYSGLMAIEMMMTVAKNLFRRLLGLSLLGGNNHTLFSSRRSGVRYVFTVIYTCLKTIHVKKHAYIHTYIHTYMHACMHTYNIYIGLKTEIHILLLL